MWRPVQKAVCASLLLACACSKAKRAPEPASPPPATPAPSVAGRAKSQQDLLSDITTSGVTRERATQLFAMAVGPLPGIAAPAGKRDSTDFDGTLAVGYLYQVWDSLTPEQQRAATRLIRGARADSGTPRTSDAGGRSLFRTVALATTMLADSPAFDYSALAHRADYVLSAEMNVSQVAFVGAVGYGPPLGTEYAHTWTWDPYTDGKCHITVWNQKFQGLDSTGALSIITHEMFHCYQQRALATSAAWLSVKPWILEGEPTWAMVAAVPTVTGLFIENKWVPYINGPKTEYYKRWYDAVGVFAHQSDLVGDNDVWNKLLLVALAGQQGANASAFALLIQGNETPYYSSWAASYFQVQQKASWFMQGPGTPPTYGPNPDVVTVDDGTAKMLASIPSDQAQLWKIEGHADIVIVLLLTGYGRLHDEGFHLDTQLTDGQPLALCLKDGGCTCPDGTPGASLVTKQATRPVAIGVDGGDQTVQLGVVGDSLGKFCKHPDPPPVLQLGDGGGGGGGGGNPGPDSAKKPDIPQGVTRGDTHLFTFDGVLYDLQAVGEFTLVRSTKDDFAVQVRQIAPPGSRSVAVNQAMATKLGTDRISVAVENRAAVLRINGKVINGPLPRLTVGTLTRSTGMFGDTYEMTWPDGTIVRAQQIGRNLNVQVQPSAFRRGNLVGLLGDGDGSPENDLVGLRGVRLGSHPSPIDVNHSLADAWRITQAQSLFMYQPGQSTATFTDRTFPGKDPDPSIVKNRVAAEQYCKDVGVTDPHLLDDCVLDLAVTNDFVFGSDYAHAQHVLAARLALHKPSPSTSAAQKTIYATGEILDHTSEPEFHFDATKEDVIWVHDPDCVDRLPNMHPVGFTLLAPSGANLGFGIGCEFNRRELPETGTYTLRAVFKYHNETARWRVPIRFVRPDRHASMAYGQSITGTIDMKAARDVYTFTAQAGDVLKISGAGCDVGSLILGIVDPQGHEIGGLSCRKDESFKVLQSGNYQLVVNSFDGGPAPYQFVFQGGAFK
jgi:hypothetical protein